MQRVQTVEHANNEHDEDHHHRRQVVRLLNCGSLMRRVEQQHGPPAVSQTNCADGETNHLERGDAKERRAHAGAIRTGPRPLHHPRHVQASQRQDGGELQDQRDPGVVIDGHPP